MNGLSFLPIKTGKIRNMADSYFTIASWELVGSAYEKRIDAPVLYYSVKIDSSLTNPPV